MINPTLFSLQRINDYQRNFKSVWSMKSILFLMKIKIFIKKFNENFYSCTLGGNPLEFHSIWATNSFSLRGGLKYKFVKKSRLTKTILLVGFSSPSGFNSRFLSYKVMIFFLIIRIRRYSFLLFPFSLLLLLFQLSLKRANCVLIFKLNTFYEDNQFLSVNLWNWWNFTETSTPRKIEK